jgi:DNA-binding transcriptional MerR regulator
MAAFSFEVLSMHKLATVSRAVGVPAPTLASWIDRGLVDLGLPPGTGRPRTFTRDDIIRVALVAELVRLGVSVSEAAKAAATFSDDAGADRDAAELFPNGRTVLIVDADGARVINVEVPRETFDAAMNATYGETRAVIAVVVNTVVARVDAGLASGSPPRGGVAMLFRNGRQMHVG